MWPRHRWTWGVILLAAGCASAPSASTSGVASSAPRAGATAAPVPDQVETRAEQLVSRAKALEPSVTPALEQLAEKAGGALVKLEHRFKTPASTARKLRLELANDPVLDLATFTLGDSLRYTMVVDDQPPGHHVEAVQATLEALEAQGHGVVKVKNYWPRNDNYSGINSVLQAPEGLPWELQFHTVASLKAQADTRPQYEELRLRATPIERKRELFDRMTDAWNAVPLPEGILEPEALHGREQIKSRPRP